MISSYLVYYFANVRKKPINQTIFCPVWHYDCGSVVGRVKRLSFIEYKLTEHEITEKQQENQKKYLFEISKMFH